MSAITLFIVALQEFHKGVPCIIPQACSHLSMARSALHGSFRFSPLFWFGYVASVFFSGIIIISICIGGILLLILILAILLCVSKRYEK